MSVLDAASYNPAAAVSASPKPRLRSALLDLVQGLEHWRGWWVLATMDVQRRYRRSVLGQLWLTISMAATIAGIGITFGVILGQDLTNYIPFLGFGFIVWNLLSGLVNDLATSYISSEVYLKSYPGPRSFVIYGVIARNLITAAHNMILVPVLIVLFQVPITWSTLLFLPGLALVILNSIWLGMLIGPLCTRFRDMLSIITSVMQLVFFITPIMFRSEQLQERLWLLTKLNPFASLVEILRAPLLGTTPPAYDYLVVLGLALVGFAFALPFYARFRGRIVYWL